MRLGFLGTPRTRDRIARVLLCVVLLAALGYFAKELHQHYPIEKWLFWRYAGYWLGSLAFLAACTSLGLFALRLVWRESLTVLERLAIGFPLGVFLFEIVMFLLGLMQLYGTVCFVLVPPLLFAVGARPLFFLARRCARRFGPHRKRVGPLGFPWFAAVVFGLVGFAMIYFLILTPGNVQFDSRWKHMALAEDFVAHGGVRRFPEGWVFSARPHMTSFVYTWAFMLPKSMLFDRILLCAHLEFVVFLMTTFVGIPAMVRKLAPGSDPRLSWIPRFLFPGVFLYDSTLSGGADHFGAMFTVPLFLLSLHFWRRPSRGAAILIGVFMASAAVLKETVALMLVSIPAIIVTLRGVLSGIGELRKRRARGALQPLGQVAITAATALLMSSPLWLMNLIYYGDPFYPVFHGWFSPRPWTPDAGEKLAYSFLDTQMWAPTRDMKGVLESLKVLFTFSLVPNDWPQFHGKVPVFGSLFTLLLPSLLFLGKRPRLWLLVLWVHVSIMCWYWVHHQDRYLQALMPMIAGATSAMIVLVWRRAGHVVKATLSLLIGLQVIWGGDVYFIQTHAMIKAPLKVVMDLLASGYNKNYDQRLRIQDGWVDLGKMLPEGARVLIHEQHDHLGTRRERVLDSSQYQFGISYGLTGSPRGMYDLMKKLGVTHIYWRDDSRGVDSLAADILFYDFSAKRAEPMPAVAGGHLAKVPTTPPSDAFDDSVLVVGCGAGYASGSYRIEDLRVPVFGPRSRTFPAPRVKANSVTEWSRLLAESAYFVIDSKCPVERPPTLGARFERLAVRKSLGAGRAYEIWARK